MNESLIMVSASFGIIEAAFLRLLSRATHRLLVAEIERASAEYLVNNAFNCGLSLAAVCPLLEKGKVLISKELDVKELMGALKEELTPECIHANLPPASAITLTEVRKALKQLLNRDKTKAKIEEACLQLLKNGALGSASRERIQKRAHLRLNNRIYEAAAEAAKEPTPALSGLSLRGLRILTALAVGSHESESERISLLRTSCKDASSSFPYVVKRVACDRLPRISFFSDQSHSSLKSFESLLLPIFPQITNLLTAIDGYCHGQCYLEKHIDPLKPPHEQISGSFSRLPKRIKVDGATLKKEDHLHNLRRQNYRIVEGVICCTAMVGLLEIILTQIQAMLGLAGGAQARGNELVTKLVKAHPVSQALEEHLNIVYPRYDMGMRDLLSHGLFVFQDPRTLSKTLHGLAATCYALIKEVYEPLCLQGQQSVQGRDLLSLEARDTIIAQARDAPLETKLDKDLEKLLRSTDMLNRMAGDKSTQYKAAWMLWGESSKGSSGFASFYGLMLILGVFEPLLRAVFRVVDAPEVFVTHEVSSSSVKCEYAIIDSRTHNLLSPMRLSKVFGKTASDKTFQEVLRAGKEVRDTVMHGRWNELAGLEHEALELLLKLCYALLLAPIIE